MHIHEIKGRFPKESGKAPSLLEIEQKKREYERRRDELDARFKQGEVPEKEWKAEIKKMKEIREEIEKDK